jgi:hypothetical protein
MGSRTALGRFNSRIGTNSFSYKEQQMAFPLQPKLFFGFPSKTMYSYNLYHQLADNGAGFGARGARWARYNGIAVSFSQN